jgi:ubiquinone biosynthesis protein
MARPIPSIGQTFRNIRRAQEILTVFASYGFTDVVQELGIDRFILRGKRLVGLADADEKVQRQSQAVRLRRAMESLGPTFIKMAQILSTRPDLIPKEWADEFARLQSDVPAVEADKIQAHIESLYEQPLDEIFKQVDFDAIAAASIAQAHRATLKDGTEVILKVLRPRISDVLEADLEILQTLADFAESHFRDLGYSPAKVVDQFRRQVKREIDTIHEGRATDRMSFEFEDNPHVHFPLVHWEYTRKGVLCLEFIQGTLLSNRTPDSFTPDELCDIVAYGADAVFHQCFEAGFFHADPHPGNIIVRGRGEDLQVVFIDCGMTGHIDPRTAEQLADLVHSTIGGNLDHVIDIVIDMTSSSPSLARDRVIRADVWEFISRFESVRLQDLHMGELLSDFFEKVRRHHLECPADIVYLIKAITTIEGVGEALSPSFDLVAHVRPHLERLVRRRYGFRAVRRRLETSGVAYAELLEAIPREARNLTHLLRKDRFDINLNHVGLDRVVKELERASRNISYALIVSALLVAGSIMFLSNAMTDDGSGLLFSGGLAAVGVAGLLALWRLIFGGRV